MMLHPDAAPDETTSTLTLFVAPGSEPSTGSNLVEPLGSGAPGEDWQPQGDEAAYATPRPRELDLRRAVRELLERQARNWDGERRRSDRLPFPRIVRLLPVSRDGQPLAEQAVPAIGRHLGPQGLDFFHLHPLPTRHVLAALDPSSAAEPFLLDVRWSRFLPEGWYLSGGRFLALATMPPTHGRLG